MGMGMGIVLGGVFASALAFAFAAQWLLEPLRRTGLILAAAAAPALVLLTIGAIWMFVAGMIDSWFDTFISFLFFLAAFLVPGLIAAILGSELASLVKWLLRRRR